MSTSKERSLIILFKIVALLFEGKKEMRKFWKCLRGPTLRPKAWWIEVRRHLLLTLVTTIVLLVSPKPLFLHKNIKASALFDGIKFALNNLGIKSLRSYL